MFTVLEKVNLLQKVGLFQGVRTESLARLASVAEEVHFEPRQFLFRENDAADTLFVLLEGGVTLLRNGKESQKLGTNQVVGFLSLLAGSPQSESALVIQPVRALRIDQQDFYDAMAEDFNLTRGILCALVSLTAGAV